MSVLLSWQKSALHVLKPGASVGQHPGISWVWMWSDVAAAAIAAYCCSQSQLIGLNGTGLPWVLKQHVCLVQVWQQEPNSCSIHNARAFFLAMTLCLRSRHRFDFWPRLAHCNATAATCFNTPTPHTVSCGTGPEAILFPSFTTYPGLDLDMLIYQDILLHFFKLSWFPTSNASSSAWPRRSLSCKASWQRNFAV